MDKKSLICVVAQLDPTGAAGLGRASSIVARLGARVAPVASGIAIQTDRRVKKIVPVDARTLRSQLGAVWERRPPDAIFLGALPSTRIGRALLAYLNGVRRRPPIVMDPALRATSGRALAIDDVRETVIRLCPLVTLLTPNALEAAALTGIEVRDTRGARAAAQALVERGAAAVLVKGGHVPGRTVRDVLVTRARTRTYSAARIAARVRGTGCALAAAATVHLALGEPVERAVARARSVVRRELLADATAGTRSRRGKR